MRVENTDIADIDNPTDDKTDEVVKSGDLAVTAKAASDRKVIVSGIDGDTATVSDLDTLTFKTSEDVEISKVTLERYGYSSNEDVEGVWLEDEDGNVISNEGTLNTKGQANLTIKKDYRKVDGTFSATVVLKMKAWSEAGKTIGFKVIDVVSTAKNVDLGNYNPYTYDTVVYNWAEVTFTVRWTTKEYNLETGKSYEVSKFKVKAPADSALLVKGFTLTNLAGTKQEDAEDDDNNYDYSDLKQLDVEKFMDKVVVKVNDKEVKASANINKDDELVISFKDDVEVAAKENAEFTVEMSFSEDFDAYDSSIVYAIAKDSHFNAIDAKTQSRVSMPSDEAMAGKSWPTYTIKWGKVKLTNTKLGNIDWAIDSVDVQIAEGSITVGETIKWNLTVNITPNPVAGAIIAMRLQVAGDEYAGTPDNKTAPTKFNFSNVEIEKGGKIKLLVDITDKAEIDGEDVEGGQYGFTLDGWDSFYYTEGKTSDKVDISWSITPSKLTIQAARASLTRDLTKDVEFKNKAADRKPVFEWTYTTKKWSVKLNEFLLEWTYNADNKVTFYLLIDGEEVADAKLWTDGKASDTFSDVEVEAGKSVKVVVEAEVNAKNDSPLAEPIELGNFDLTLRWEDNNGNKAGEITKKTAKLKIVESGTAKISDATVSSKTVALKEAEAVIAEFTLKPANGASEVDFDYLEFEIGEDGAWLTPADVTVYIDGVEEFPTANDAFKYAPTTTIDKEGVVVKVTLNDEDKANGTITLTVKTINSTEGVNEEFSKTFASALVYINSQTKVDKEYTKYTLGVKKYDDSDSIVGLKLYTDAACSEPLTLVGIELTDKITDGKSFTITALDTWAPIKCIKYRVADEDETEITTAEASDYFKVGLKENGDDWYVYSNN